MRHSTVAGASGKIAGHHVAGELGRPVGRLLMLVKSAHVYQTEFEYVRGVMAQSK